MPLPRFIFAVAAFCAFFATPIVFAAPATSKANVVIVAVKGKEVTLDAGSQDGVLQNALYGVTQNGMVVAKVAVTKVRSKESTGYISQPGAGAVVTVGDNATFIRLLNFTGNRDDYVFLPPLPNPLEESVPAATGSNVVAPIATTAPPVVVPPSVPLVTDTTPTTRATPVPPQPPATTPGTAATATAPGGNAYVTEVKGSTVSLNAGTDRGVAPGAHLPVVRGGNVVALVRVQTASPAMGTGILIWRDETVAAPTVGDSVALMGGVTPAGGTPTGTAVPGGGATPPTPTTSAPAVTGALMPFETGLSNMAVPRADRIYEHLATLAAWDIITRYPAAVFHDDGTRGHRTEEDITFTRAQIADLLREALASPKLREPEGKVTAVMSELLGEFGSELRQLGVSSAALAAASGKPGFAWAHGSQRRATLVGGDTGSNVIEPFAERQGGRRTRSGIDSRTNLFVRAGENLRFFGSLDSGTDTRRGLDERRFDLRRAVASYNAGRHVSGLTVEVGRDELWWGPGHFGTLLLSDVAGSLNLIHTTVKRGSLKFEGLYAPLDRGPLGGSRSLYGHNIQFQFTPQLRLGLAETVLLPKDRLDPVMFAGAFVPFPLFTLERLRHQGASLDNGNAIIMPYVEAGVARGAQAYVEVLLDDLGTNNKNLVRSRAGTLAGVHFFTPRDPAKLGLYAEYANLEGRTYLGLLPVSDNDFFYRGNPLGSAVAPLQGAGNGGASSLRFNSYWSPRRRIRLSLGAEFSDINSEQPVLSRQQVLRARAAYDISQKWTLTARAQRVQTSQPNFIAGEPAIHQNLFQLEVASAF